MQKKRVYELLQIEICRLYDDLIRTSFDDGNESSSSADNGEWDVFE